MAKQKAVSDLKGNPSNPRKITPEQLTMLGQSVVEFGDLGGVVFNRRTDQLVGGHQRKEVFGPESTITIVKTYSPPTRTGTVAEGYIEVGGENFAYREVDWDLKREKAANIAANKHGGFFDLPKLREWIIELDHENFDLKLAGFDAEGLDLLMAEEGPRANQKPEGKSDPDTLKFVTCPSCEDEFELKQAKVRSGK